MKLSDIQPESDLKQLLLSGGITEQIYARGERPSSSLPKEFIDIALNGSINRQTTDRGIYRCIVSLTINVALKANDSINTTRESILFKKVEDIIEGSGRFFTTPNNTVFYGKSITAGYSSTVINIGYNIY
ncbi:hypothetical protein PF672P2_00019 [Parabacteroides phage PF672P2]|nr:hypothetical protein PF672P1_00058 [Parabacteroides phage PF672P1]WAX17156.1 hypothetical protein PF672P2_00019 [Parabacteroides phage PF672P2]